MSAGEPRERERGGGTEEELWQRRPCDILLLGIPGPGLVNSPKWLFGVSHPTAAPQ